MRGSRVALVLVLALVAYTCSEQGRGGVQPGGDVEIGLLALDLEPMAADLRAETRLPTTLTIRLDGEVAGRVTLPEPEGLLPGHATIPLAADRPVELTVRALYADGSEASSEGVEIRVGKGELLRLPVLVGVRRLILADAERFTLPEEANLAVTFRDQLREPAVLGELPAEVARAITSVLRDPQTESVAPFTARPSRTDEIGPLVGIDPVQAAATATPEPARLPAPEAPPTFEVSKASPSEVEVVVSVPQRPPAPAPPEDDPAPSTAGDFLYYYSFCDCGKPVPDKPYTLTTRDGHAYEGRTDRFGMVLLAGVDRATSEIDFGRAMKPRTRSYVFDRSSPATHAAMLAELGSEIVNDQLTALLDLRRLPLEDAREILVALLDHPNPVTYLNAAVTLSYYPSIADVVSARASVLEVASDSPTIERELTILGALRHPAAVPRLAGWLVHQDPALRSLAAWGLGFNASRAAMKPLEGALKETNPEVLAEVQAALMRVDDFAARAGFFVTRDWE